MFKSWSRCLVLFIVLLGTSSLFAAKDVVMEQLQMPNCLYKALPKAYEVLAETQTFKIINVPPQEIDDISRMASKTRCGRFINVSHRFKETRETSKNVIADRLLLDEKPRYLRSSLLRDYRITQKAMVEKAINLIVPEQLWDKLAIMTGFVNRSATQKLGVDTAHWLREEFNQLVRTSGRESDTESYFIKTGGRYIQPSLVTVIGKHIKAPAVVIGAHMDTLGRSAEERMPGAGDDGSGSMTALEVARVLLALPFEQKRPIYIVWYAAEEQGLVGSQQVVRYFKDHKIPVYTAIQFDMTGYRNAAEDPTIWVFQDYTDKALSDFLVELITTYVKVPVDYSTCGYGCSDHASWTEVGVPAAFPCETSFNAHNPFIHTASDTMSLLNLEHMTNFTKLGLAFAIELAS